MKGFIIVSAHQNMSSTMQSRDVSAVLSHSDTGSFPLQRPGISVSQAQLGVKKNV